MPALSSQLKGKVMECPICNQEFPEEELLDGVGPCYECKDRIDQQDFEEELKVMEEND